MKNNSHKTVLGDGSAVVPPASSEAERRKRLKASFLHGSGVYAHRGSALYSYLCSQIAEDRQLLAIADSSPAASQRDYHFLAAIHYLLLDPANADHRLARFYPTLTSDPLAPEQSFAAFRAFCLENASAVQSVLQSKPLQITMAERAAGLSLSLGELAAQTSLEFNLIEIGCSAGLLLLFDQYRYDFGRFGRLGKSSAPGPITTELAGVNARRPSCIPHVRDRIGIDLDPLDVESSSGRRWLSALLYPEWKIERDNLHAALSVLVKRRPQIEKGDALELLPGVASHLEGPVCVFHSFCLYYWSVEEKRELDRLLLQIASDRPVYRLGIESPAKYIAIAKGEQASRQGFDRSEFFAEVTCTSYQDGVVASHLWAKCGAFSEWFEWLI